IKYCPLNMGLSVKGVEYAVNKSLALTDTADWKGKPPHVLSIGQKKRGAISGVLAMKPEIMVLDEPTAGLDPYYAKKIMDVLNRFSSPDKSIILSTHDVNLGYEWADEILIMNNGEIASQGRPDVVFQDQVVLEK